MNDLEKQKIKFPSELAYISALILQAFGVALAATADLGLSMVVAPAYLLSLKLGNITFGQAEYIMEAIVFVLMCILVRKFKLSYLFSIISLLIYGAALDAWRFLVPFLNPAITIPGAASFSYPVRILLFVSGMLIIQFTIALSFKSYLTQLVVDFFIEEVADHFHFRRGVFKTCFDITFFAISIAMSFALFGKLRAIGLGTIIQVSTNGIIVGFFDKGLSKIFDFPICCKKLSKFVGA